MKILRSFSLLLIPMLLGAGLVAAEQLYTCGMHPQIIKSAPGDCPICGMKLTPIRANTGGKASPGATSGERKVKFYKSTMIPGEVKPAPGKDSMGMDMVPVYEDEDQSAATAIQIDPATIQRMNLKTALVERGPVRRLVRAVGTVEFDEAGLFDVTTKYEGWIEKLFVNTTWATVKAGDPLFEIYSPDLYNAQLNYLVARRAEAEPGSLSQAARARLALFDVSDDFVNELVRKGEPSRTYIYRAPAAGVVVDKMAVQGQMMKPGERIYRLADLSSVWWTLKSTRKTSVQYPPGRPPKSAPATAANASIPAPSPRYSHRSRRRRAPPPPASSSKTPMARFAPACLSIPASGPNSPPMPSSCPTPPCSAAASATPSSSPWTAARSNHAK